MYTYSVKIKHFIEYGFLLLLKYFFLIYFEYVPQNQRHTNKQIETVKQSNRAAILVMGEAASKLKSNASNLNMIQ